MINIYTVLYCFFKNTVGQKPSTGSFLLWLHSLAHHLNKRFSKGHGGTPCLEWPPSCRLRLSGGHGNARNRHRPCVALQGLFLSLLSLRLRLPCRFSFWHLGIWAWSCRIKYRTPRRAGQTPNNSLVSVCPVQCLHLLDVGMPAGE